MGKKVRVQRDTVRAWVADAAQAKNISTKDLEVIQKKFSNKLTIKHLNDGGIAIYPSTLNDRAEFDSFMERNGAFKEKPIEKAKN